VGRPRVDKIRVMRSQPVALAQNTAAWEEDGHAWPNNRPGMADAEPLPSSCLPRVCLIRGEHPRAGRCAKADQRDASRTIHPTLSAMDTTLFSPQKCINDAFCRLVFLWPMHMKWGAGRANHQFWVANGRVRQLPTPLRFSQTPSPSSQSLLKHLLRRPPARPPVLCLLSPGSWNPSTAIVSVSVIPIFADHAVRGQHKGSADPGEPRPQSQSPYRSPV